VQNNIRSVILEEFVPVDRVCDMLVLADRLLDLLPIQKAPVAENLRRSMVWMVKYIAPTSEFWDWQTFEEPLDNQTHLRVKFIGLGWLIALIRSFTPTDQVSPSNVESELAKTLDKITGHIPVNAVARLKSTPWSPKDLRGLASALAPSNLDLKINRRTRTLTTPGVEINFHDQERVSLTQASTELDARARQVLADIKRWGNAEHRYEGADWCAYKRRRLTMVVKRVSISRATPEASDFDFTNEPTGLFVRNRPTDYDCIVESNIGRSTMGAVIFPLYPYHTGVINPRVVVRATSGLKADALTELLHYISYLWVNHYTRLWCYLDFEDQFAYASDIWHRKELNEQALVGYTSRALHFEELRSSIEMLNRVDAGEISAYVPPHSKFSFAAAKAGNTSVIESLRLTLIPSTMTQLRTDPLVNAPEVMRHASAELSQAYGTFSQAASLRMQRVLQILQAVFILAAVAALLALIPIGNVINGALVTLISHNRTYLSVYNAKESVSWMRQFHFSLYLVQGLTLFILFAGAMTVLRWHVISRILKRFLE
jgi:hypothetical protein